jgi:hypothetical protein
MGDGPLLADCRLSSQLPPLADQLDDGVFALVAANKARSQLFQSINKRSRKAA